MEHFMYRNYRLILIGFLAVIVVSAFYLGFVQGKRQVVSPVTVSCDPKVLTQLQIPVEKIAQGDQRQGSGSMENGSTNGDAVAVGGTTSETNGGAGISGSQNNSQDSVQTGKYVASKHGKKYYGASCAGAKRIKPANQVWFTSKEDAELQGYTATTKC